MRTRLWIIALHLLLIVASYLYLRYFYAGGDFAFFLCYPIAAGLFAGFFFPSRWGFSVGIGNVLVTAQCVAVLVIGAGAGQDDPRASHCNMLFLAVMIGLPSGMILLTAIAAIGRGVRWLIDRMHAALAVRTPA